MWRRRQLTVTPNGCRFPPQRDPPSWSFRSPLHSLLTEIVSIVIRRKYKEMRVQLTFHNVLRDWMWLRSQGPHEHRTKLPVCRQRACRATGQPRRGGVVCVCGEEGEGCPPADNPATGNEGLEFVWKTISLLNMDYKMVSWWIYGK